MADNQITVNSLNNSNQHNNNNSTDQNQNSKKNAKQISLKVKIPNATETQQIHEKEYNKKTQKAKKKKRDKSDLGDNFVAPDGGWGWVVAIAAGVCTLVTFALGQQFGIVFKDHMQILGISSSQLTTIINTQIAVSAFTGLLNGPLFRKFTFRQVALIGATINFLGLFLSVFANTFLFYIASYSCLYGFGRGLIVSASSMAVNTYFKLKRRTATSYLFGVAGLGPIFFPHLATFLLNKIGVQGTVAIFAAITLNNFACAFIYQPVKWHVKQKLQDAEEANGNEKKPPIEGSEVIQCIAEPETPILPCPVNTKYGSHVSLNTMYRRNRLSSWDKHFDDATQQMHELKTLNGRSLPPYVRKISLTHGNVDVEQTLLPHKEEAIALNQTKMQQNKMNNETDAFEMNETAKNKWYKSIIATFDLDLLRDITYVNLAVGLTLINFVEINFAILTPFILNDFGFTSLEIAMAMSTLAFCDLVIRFMIPFITARVSYSNKTLFCLGIFCMCMGRFALPFTKNTYVLLGVFGFMGANKAFRTVCWNLIIPEYVPLKRLPAAAGLQLLISGIFSLACGPVIGLVRDVTNYAVTLYFLNSLCLIAIALWILEAIIRKHPRVKNLNNENN